MVLWMASCGLWTSRARIGGFHASGPHAPSGPSATAHTPRVWATASAPRPQLPASATTMICALVDLVVRERLAGRAVVQLVAEPNEDGSAPSCAPQPSLEPCCGEARGGRVTAAEVRDRVHPLVARTPSGRDEPAEVSDELRRLLVGEPKGRRVRDAREVESARERHLLCDPCDGR